MAENAENKEKDKVKAAPTEEKPPDKAAKADKAAEKAERVEAEKLKAEAASLKAELEKAKAEAADSRDRLLRTAAEYDNFRKRSAREKDTIYADAVSATVAAILPVADNLERAVAFADADGLRGGLELTVKQLAEVLKKLGVSPLDPKGEPFDPQLHNAVMHVEDEALGENTVSEVLQKGYMLGDKVIRHAVVKVAN